MGQLATLTAVLTVDTNAIVSLIFEKVVGSVGGAYWAGHAANVLYARTRFRRPVRWRGSSPDPWGFVVAFWLAAYWVIYGGAMFSIWLSGRV